MRIIRWNLIKSLALGVLFFTLFFGLTSVSRAEMKEEGMYFSVLRVENSIGGDFDGVKWYQNDEKTSTCYVPEIDSDTGFGILFGVYNDKMAGEISYLYTTHDANYSGTPYDGEVELINFDMKLYGLSFLKQKVRTYLIFGLVIPKITFEKAANNETNVGDGIYSGYGLNLGLGTEIRIHRKIGIDGSVVFRRMKIDQVEILETKWEPENNFYASGRSYSVKINYYF